MNWLSALIYLSEITSKIWLLLLSILIFSGTTSLNSLVNALATPKIRIRIGIRSIVIGIPKRFSVVFITVLLFIPTISSQIRKVVVQQKARGYKVNIFRLKPILVPVILYLLDLSMKLSLSMESRGFDV
jgi:energy-coupling factor transporter transmembrane protein EcfT